MLKLLETFKKWWELLAFIVGAIMVVFSGCGWVVRKIDAQNVEMNKTIQMAEKSIIWNKDIPRIERASVCDDYLSRGFNSYTKKLCENVILNENYIEDND